MERCLKVTEKNAPQMEANTAIMEDAPAMIFFLHAVSEADQGNPNGMVAAKPQNCAFYRGFAAL